MSQIPPIDPNADPKTDPPARGKGGKFTKKPPAEDPPKPPADPPKDNSLLEEISKDLEEEIKLKFGDLDLSHLPLESRVKTMRSMIKSKPADPKPKPSISETEGENPIIEWKPEKSLLQKGKDLKEFYNKRRQIGGNLYEEIFDGK